MKRNVVLITNCGNEPANRGAKRDQNTDRRSQRFDVLSLGLDDIDLAIVDVGVNLQSLAIIEALTHTKPAPPVIALVDGKNAKATPELQRHGAAACLRKPFCADELARLIEVVCAHTSQEPSCDKRGHVRSSSLGK